MIQGWYPKKFEAINTEMIVEAMHYFDGADFGEHPPEWAVRTMDKLDPT